MPAGPPEPAGAEHFHDYVQVLFPTRTKSENGNFDLTLGTNNEDNTVIDELIELGVL